MMWVCTSTFPHVQEVEVDVVIDEGFCSTVSVEEAETLRRDITLFNDPIIFDESYLEGHVACVFPHFL